MANSIWQATIQNEAGDIIPGAEITVTDEDTGLPATIFSSIGGAAKSNPFFADSNGFAQFYAGSGTYRVNAEDTGTGQSQLWRYIRFGDAASRDVGTSAGQLMEVGAFGSGGDGIDTDWDNAGLGSLIASSTNSPVGGTSFLGVNIKGSGNFAAAFAGRNDAFYARTVENGTVQAWREIWTSANYQPEVSGTGIGVVRILKNNTGPTGDGSITPGSNLDLTYADSTGSLIASGLPPAGTWKQVAGFSLTVGNFSWYVRIS